MTRLDTLSQLAYIRWVPKDSRHEAPCRLPCIPPGNAALLSPPPYASSSKRSPTQPLVQIPYTLSEVIGPSFGSELVSPDGGKYAHPEETQDNPWNRDSSGTAECLLTSTDPFASPRSSPGRCPGDVRNTNAPIMNLVEPARRSTLIAKNTEAGPGMLEGSVVLQGPDETGFFDLGL